jgi:hypothetical protein
MARPVNEKENALGYANLLNPLETLASNRGFSRGLRNRCNTPTTGFHFACFVTMPIPKSDPTLTCVVLTGNPW